MYKMNCREEVQGEPKEEQEELYILREDVENATKSLKAWKAVAEV